MKKKIAFTETVVGTFILISIISYLVSIWD